MEPISKKHAATRIILALVTPLAVSTLAITFYICAWNVRMRAAGIPSDEAPLALVMQNGIMLGVAIGLWSTVLLWWFLHGKRASFSTLFATQTDNLVRDIAVGNP